MTFIARRQRVTDPDGTLVLLELAAASFGSPVRLVDDTRNWTVGGNLYTGFPFRFTLPDDTAGQAPRAVLEIDNVGREVTADLENLDPGELITATIRLTDKTEPETIFETMVLPMVNVHVDQSVITAQVGVDWIMRQAACRLRYNGHTAPGLF